MINIALIKDNTILEAFLVDEVPEHLSTWTEVPIEVGPGYTFTDGVWSPPVIVPPVPEKVSRFQARAALYQMGLLEAAEALTTMAGGLTEIAWSDATEFYRDSPSIAGLAPHLNLTEEQIDDLFRLASTIKA